MARKNLTPKIVFIASVMSITGIISVFILTAMPYIHFLKNYTTSSRVETRKSIFELHASIHHGSLKKLAQKAANRPDKAKLGTEFGAQLRTSFSAANISWLNLGPQPVLDEFWTGRAPASGRVVAIVVHPYNSDIIYIAAAQGGVWKSTDNGLNWTPLTDDLSSLSSGDLAMDPSDSNVLYYGTGEMHFSGSSCYGDGLFRTVNGGNSWKKIASKTTIGSYISRILVRPNMPNIIHLTSDKGYVRSIDGGETWTVQLNANWCNDLVFDPENPSILYAAVHATGIYKSVDDGETWTKLAGGLPQNELHRINLAISLSNPNILYASFITDEIGELLGMYKTADSGTSWTHLVNTPNYVNSQGWYDNCLIVHPTNPDICYAGGVFPFYSEPSGGIIKTSNGGESWRNITRGATQQVHPDQHCFAWDSNFNLWVGCDGGVWKTENAGFDWINRNATLGITQFYSIALHPTRSDFLVGGTQDQGSVSFEGSIGWPQVMAGDGGPCAIEWDSPGIFYSTYLNMKPIYRLDNFGLIRDVTGLWREEGDRASRINGPLEVDPHRPNTLLAGTYRVWRTTDSGENWTPISGDLTDGEGVLLSLAVAGDEQNTIYSGSSDGSIFITTDGVNWFPRNNGLISGPINDIIVDPLDWMHAFLIVDVRFGGIYKTATGGQLWENITGDFPQGLRMLSLECNFNTTPPSLYVGTDYGVYSSQNDGISWIKEDNGLPSIEIFDLAVNSSRNELVAATHGRGIYRASLPAVSVSERKDTYVENYDLTSNYPNPFNPHTSFEYALPYDTHVLIQIFNIRGETVRTLVDARESAGRRSVHWDSRDDSGNLVSAGVYLYRIFAGDFVKTKKMTLLR